MMKNCGPLYLNHMGYLLLLQIQVYTNESSMANILSFADVANSAGVHIKMDTSKVKVINFPIEDGKIIHFKACEESFSAPILMTPP